MGLPKGSKTKAAGKAKAARASAKSGAVGSGGAGRKKLTIPQRAQQKLRENFKNLSEHAQYVRVWPQSARTLYQQLQVDIENKDSGDNTVQFGGKYYEAMCNRYSDDDSFFGLLRPDAKDETPPDDDLLEVDLCRHSLVHIYIYLYMFGFLLFVF